MRVHWVYINEPNNKALVHLGSCSFCNEGQGMTRDKLDHNGKWEGPFGVERAEQVARKSGKDDVRWCGHCARQLGRNRELG